MIVPFKPKNCPKCQGHVLIGLVSRDDYFKMLCPHCGTRLMYDTGLIRVEDEQVLTTKGEL